MKKVCFTGHRKIPIYSKPRLMNLLTEYIEDLVSNGVYDYYAGGALGWDTMAAEAVLTVRNKNENVKLHLILPCDNASQTAKFTISEKTVFDYILNLADTVEYTSQKYFPGCMARRNRKLVEYADLCLCYYDDKNKSGGTLQTINFAKEKGIPVFNFKTGENMNSNYQIRLNT